MNTTQQPSRETTCTSTGEQPSSIQQTLLILSGKGGVGKSTVAVNIATTMAQQGLRVGLLDVDIHGPSIPTLLNLTHTPILSNGQGILPVEIGTLKVMSIGLLFEDKKTAMIWRGPMKANVIQQLLKDVQWGNLDCLVVDLPPGTGDEPLTICQSITSPKSALLVTTPQELALADVRRSITFCWTLKLPIVGIVENMSGYVCPKCGEQIDLLKKGGGEELAKEMDIPFAGRIPLMPSIVHTSDDGTPCTAQDPSSSAAQYFVNISDKIQSQWEGVLQTT